MCPLFFYYKLLPSEVIRMERSPVSSSNLRSVGYDRDSSTLEIEFNGGAIYQYLNVPMYVFQELMNASSHGSYFSAHIRDSYQYRRIR